MTWIFGYGSLVSPASLESTIRRPVTLGDGMFVAELAGYQRAWNYGSGRRGDWTRADGSSVVGGLVVALGLMADDAASINGVVFSVNDDELAELDWRERSYDRVDVSDRITLIPPTAAGELDDSVAVYVPRRVAIERYEAHRDAGTAGVRKSYWDLVDDAFGELGPDHLDWYRRTPPPDIPVVDIRLDPLPSPRPRSR